MSALSKFSRLSSPLGSYSTFIQRFRITNDNVGRELRVHQNNSNSVAGN
jgi:hypothetical protein